MATVDQNEHVEAQTQEVVKPSISPQQQPRRKFGTLLSANTPTPPRSSKKGNLFIRSGKRSARKQKQPIVIDEELQVIDFSNSTTAAWDEFTVTFDQGPIGLHLHALEDGLCRVERFSGDQSAALMSGKIEIGDIIYSVNGKRVAYDTVLDILKDTTQRRSIVFRRRRGSAVDSPSNASLETVPLNNDYSMRSTPSHRHSMQPKRLLAEASTEEDATIIEAQNELALSKKQLQALHSQVSELQEENNELRLSQKHAIQEMEFNMRLHSLEDENKALKESKAKLKKKIREMDEKWSTFVDERGEFINAPATFDERIPSDEAIKQKDETIQELVQKLEESERLLCQAQAETDGKDHQLASLGEAKTKLERQLEELQHRYDESAALSNDTNKRLLDSIRSKDVQIHKLAHDLLSSSESATSSDKSESNVDESKFQQFSPDRLHETVADLQAQLESSKNEREDALLRVEEMSGKIEKQTQTVQQLENKLHEFQKMSQAGAVLKQENTNLRTVVSQLQRSVEEMSTQRSQLQENLRTLQNEASSEKERRLTELTQVQELVQNLECENSRLQQEVKDADAKANEAVLQLEALHESEQDSKEEQVRKVGTLMKEQQDSAKAIETLQRNLAVASSNLRVAFLSEVQSRANVMELKRLNTCIFEEKEELAARLCEVRDELKSHIIEATATDKCNATLCQRNETLQSEKQALRYEMKKQYEMFQLTKQFLTDKDCDLQACERRLTDSTETYACLVDDVTHLSNEMDCLSAKLAEKNRLLCEVTEQANQRSDEVRQLREDHAVAIGSLEGEASLLRANIQELKGQRETLQTELTASIQKGRSLESKIEYEAAKQSSTITSLQDEKTRMKAKWLASAAALKVLSAEHQKINDEYSRLEQQFHEAEKSINKLNEEKATSAVNHEATRAQLQDAVREKETFANESVFLRQSLAQKEVEVHNLDMELKDLQKQLTQQRHHSGKLERELQNMQCWLTSTTESATQDRARLQHMLDDALRKCNAQSKEFDLATERYRTLSENFRQSENEKSSLLRELSSYKEHLNVLAMDKREIEKHLNEVKAEFKERKEREHTLQDEIVLLRGNFEDLENTHGDFVKKYDQSVSSSQKLESDLRTMESRHASIVSDYECRLEKANCDVSKLQSMLEEKSKSAACLVADLRTEIKTIEAAKLRLTTEHSSLQRRFDAMKEESNKQDVDRAQRKQALATTETELFKVKEKLSQLENEKEKLSEKLSLTQSSLESSESKRAEALKNLELVTNALKESRNHSAYQAMGHQEEVDNLTKQNVELSSELKASQEKLKQLNSHLRENETRVIQHDAILQNLREELQRAHEDIRVKSNHHETASRQLKEKSDRLQELMKENESLDDTLRSIRHEYSLYRTQAHECEARLNSKVLSLQSVIEEDKRQRGVFEAEILRLKEDKEKDVLKCSLAEHSEKQKRLSFLIELKDDQISSLNKECESNSKLIEELRQRNSSFEAKYSLLEKTVGKVRSESDAKLEECERRNSEHLMKTKVELNNQIQHLEEDLKVASEEKVSCEKELAALSKNLFRNEKVKASLSEELRTLEEENASLRSQLKESRELVMEQINGSNTSQETNDSMSTSSPFKGFSKQDLKLRCMDLETDLERMMDQAGFAAQDADLRSVQIKQMSDNLSRMTQEVKELTTANEELESHLRQAWSQREQAEELVKSLEQDKKAITSEFAAVKDELVEARRSKVDTEQAAKSHHLEFSKLVDDLQMKLTKLKTEKDALEQSSRQMNASSDGLKRDLADARQRVSYLSSQCERSKDTVRQLQSKHATLEDELKGCKSSHESLSIQFEQSKVELAEKDTELEKVQSDFRDALKNIQEKDQACRTLNANAAVIAEELTKSHNLITSTTEEKNRALDELETSRRAVESLNLQISEQQQTIASCQDTIAALKQEMVVLKAASSCVDEDETSSNEYVQSLEEKCKRLTSQLENLQQSECDINRKLLEYRRQIATKESCNRSLQNRVDNLKSNIKSIRSQLEDVRSDRKKLDLRCGQLDTIVVQKQMEIDQLQADLQILQSTTARLRTGTVLRENRMNVANQESSPHSFDPPEDSDDQCERMNQAIALVDGTLGQLQQRFCAISSKAKNGAMRDGPLTCDLNALDLAGLESDQDLMLTVQGEYKDLSDLVAQAQYDIAEQTKFLRRLHSSSNDFELDIVHPKSGNELLVRDFEKQLDTLLIDLRAANLALDEKDKLLEKMHDISSRHEAERSQLDRRVAELQDHLKRERSWKENAERELGLLRDRPADSRGEDECPAVACQRAAAQLLLQTIEKRTLTAKAVAFRQWACHASAQQAVARQQQVATVLSEQLQETREKLKILKKHMKKNRRGRLGTIAEGTKDNDNDDDASVESLA